MNVAKFKWHFPSTDGGDEDGINNSGLQTFQGNHETAIARECIQNSLDAVKDTKLPVEVQMQFFEMNTSDIPGVEELREDIKAARKSNANAIGAEPFFSDAVKAISEAKISVLRIGDYNTTGLIGGDSDKSGSWYGLARSNGFSQKSGSESGGSFGIGKNAPFVASGIRTVFYSTLNEKGEHIFQGKSCLASFEKDDDIKRGTGQYGQEANRGVASIRNKNDIPELFRRTETGTDIFVMGYQHPSKQRKDLLIRAVLDNFFVAIYHSKLVVKIFDSDWLMEDINAETLNDYMTNYFKDEDNEENATWAYYQAIIDATQHFEDNVKPFGKVELFVKTGLGNKTVLGMRKPLMKIHTFKKFKSAYDDFAGVCIVLDDKGNGLLKNIEPPAHNEWNPDFCRTDSCAKKEDFTALTKWIHNNIKSMYDDSNKNPEEIDDLAKYLPYDEADSNFSSEPNNNGDRSEDNKKESADELPQTPTRQPGTPGSKRKLAFEKSGTKTDRPYDGMTILARPGKGRVANEDKHVEINPDGNARFLDVTNLDVKTHEVRRGKDRVYVFNIMPKCNDSGNVRIIAIGDDRSYSVKVASAQNVATGQEYEIDGSVIKNVTTEIQMPIKIEVRLTEQYSKRRYILDIQGVK